MEYRKKTTRPAFTLIELLVVVGIISLLVSILMPSLARAKALAREVTCLTRISGQVKAVHLHATENNGAIPIGPARNQPFLPMPYRDLASNQITIAESNGFPFEYSAHGLLMGKNYVSAQMMFCPDDDSPTAIGELEEAKRGDETDIYCSYFYRQLDEVGSGVANLDNLGKNTVEDRVSALIMDANSRLPWAPIRFNHRGERINIAFVDGSANTFEQSNEEFFLRAGDMNVPGRMDEILQTADQLRQ